MVYYYGVIRLNRYQHYRKRSIRLITGSEYFAHSEPLLKELELLKIEDLYKLKILKFNPEILEKIHEKTHTYFGFNFNVTRIYLSTYTYALCPIALNVDFFRNSAIIIIVLKLNPRRSEIILFVIRNLNNAL